MASKFKFSLVHIADLRAVGGVERILVDFIKATPDVEHHLILQDKKIHPILQEVLNLVASVHSSKHLFDAFPLPKSLRTRHRLSLIKKTGAQKALIWNQVVNIQGICIPCVYYEHGSSWYPHTPEQIKLCFTSVQEVIAVSFAAKRMLQLYHHLPNSITVIHNTLRPDLMNHLANEPRRSSKQKTFVLGVAGRLVALKCIPLLILTVATLKQQGISVKAKIAGTGSQLSVIQALIEQHQLHDEIELMGLLNNMTDFYQQIDCYVCTSMHESFGLSSLEAMAYGLPVISANIDGLTEVVTDGYNGFCLTPEWSKEEYQQHSQADTRFNQWIYYPEQDSVDTVKILKPEGIAERVKTLIENSELYGQMSQNALQTATQAPAFANICKTVLAVLKNVA